MTRGFRMGRRRQGAAADDALIPSLLPRARDLGTTNTRAILGITGPPGAGKSTVAQALIGGLRADGIDVACVPMDGFHLTQDQLIMRGLRDVMGRIDTFDTDAYLALLRRLRDEPDSTVMAPDFDRTIEEPVPDAIAIGPEVRLVVTEGNYLLDSEDPWPAVRAVLDEVWFVDLPEIMRLYRLIRRHVAYGKSEDEARHWVERVDQPNARRVLTRRGAADLVISGE